MKFPCRTDLDRMHSGNSIKVTQEICNRQFDKADGEVSKVPSPPSPSLSMSLI